MTTDNNVTLTGNLTRDPEVKQVGNTTKAEFGLAVSKRWQDRETKEWKETPGFYDVTAWADIAENVRDSLSKGHRATVTGRLDYQSWEKDGQKHSKVVIIADDVSASLKWATVKITKRTKGENGSSNGNSSSNGAASKPAEAQAASTVPKAF